MTVLNRNTSNNSNSRLNEWQSVNKDNEDC